MFTLGVGILAALLQNAGQPLAADPGRDRTLHVAVREFFEGTMTTEQLNAELSDYARQFEARPYKVGRLAIELSTVPEERLKKWIELISGIIGPTLLAFTEDKITPAQAAVKVAPFLLVFGGPYGFDLGSNAAPGWSQRSEELTMRISEFAAP